MKLQAVSLTKNENSLPGSLQKATKSAHQHI